jgi:transcriptional regulator with XRE-family HTH domain
MGASHVSRIERGDRGLQTDRLDELAAALGTSPAAIFAMQEGLPCPQGAPDQAGDLTVDHSPEAVELRKAFRQLPLPSRRLVVDFARMLTKHTAT